MGKFYQCLQSYGPSFMTKFCSALYLENLLTNIFAKLNLRGGVSCMPAALLFRLGSTQLTFCQLKLLAWYQICVVAKNYRCRINRFSHEMSLQSELDQLAINISRYVQNQNFLD